MLKNYFKVAIRNLWRTKTFSVINIAGLATGLCCFILIILFVADELSYDKHFPNAERIFRANADIKFGGAETQYPFSSDLMGQTLQHDYPEVENYARLYASGGPKMVKKSNIYLTETKVAHVDSGFFNIFRVPAITGNLTTALNEPNTVVITEAIAQKYFGTSDAAGKTLETNDNRQTIYKVTAVIKNIPPNTHFDTELFFSMKNADYQWGQFLSHNFHTYLLLKPGVDYKRFSDKVFPEYTSKYVLPAAQEYMQISNMEEFKKSGNKLEYSLIPVTDIHLYSDRPYELTAGGNIQYVYIFSGVALFILLIACINFMNLTTARSVSRAKEVGIRKVLGTERKNLVLQFLCEGTITTLVSCILAITLVILVLPLFNQLAGKNIVTSALLQPQIIIGLLLLPLLVGVVAGSYPAFVLSSFRPIEVLKGKLSGKSKSGGLRSSLVVFQFVTSIILIIATTVIYNQLHYIQTKNLGFSKEQVLIIDKGYALQNNGEAYKQYLAQQPGIISTTYSSFLPTPSGRSDNVFSKEKVFDARSGFSMQEWYVDVDYLQTMGMQLVKGRNFSKEFGRDSTAVIINEKTAALLGAGDALGKQIYRRDGDNGVKTYTVIGVVKNFHFESLKRDIDMLGLFYGTSMGTLAVKINPANTESVLKAAKARWAELAPQIPFSFHFMDADFSNVYQAEQKIGQIAITFSILAILIACLGLFGLAAFIAEQRTKEIGIRKVLGANIANLVLMLSTDFLKLVVIAAIIAFPLAWWFMNSWLQNFAYRIPISWWIFVVAGIVAVVIALITVSSQAIRAALTNPVKSLRTE